MYPFRSERSRSHHPADRRAPDRRAHHPDLSKLHGWAAARAEAEIPQTEWEREKAWALKMGLTGADSLTDRSIPTFARGELPHYAGINTFLKAPYAEDVADVGRYDATVLGAPFDGGTTYRPGTRFGPQGLRKISALYTPYNYELGVDLREQMSLCDAGDIFTIPGNIEKTFDQISRAVSHVFSSGIVADHHWGRSFHRFSLCARHRRMHQQENRHRPFRPPCRYPGKGPRRADAHHSVVSLDEPAQCARQEPRSGRYRRLAGPARGRRPSPANAKPTSSPCPTWRKWASISTAEMALEMAWDGVGYGLHVL